MAGKTAYSDDDIAKLYVALTANEGNVKRTARDTGVPESTVRLYKKRFEADGPPALESVEQAVEDFTVRATRVRDAALEAIEGKIPNGKIAELTTLVGVLDDKITRAKGMTLGRVEHVHTLPPADEIRAVLDAAFRGSLEAASRREGEIIDAEIVEEQSLKELPRGR